MFLDEDALADIYRVAAESRASVRPASPIRRPQGAVMKRFNYVPINRSSGNKKERAPPVADLVANEKLGFGKVERRAPSKMIYGAAGLGRMSNPATPAAVVWNPSEPGASVRPATSEDEARYQEAALAYGRERMSRYEVNKAVDRARKQVRAVQETGGKTNPHDGLSQYRLLARMRDLDRRSASSRSSSTAPMTKVSASRPPRSAASFGEDDAPVATPQSARAARPESPSRLSPTRRLREILESTAEVQEDVDVATPPSRSSINAFADSRERSKSARKASPLRRPNY